MNRVLALAALLAVCPASAATLESASTDVDLLLKELSAIKSDAAPADSAAPAAKEAPDFELIDAQALLQGTIGKTTLKEFRGKAVLLDFWSTRCPPCRAATATMQELHRKYADQGLVVIGLSQDSNPDAVKAYLKEHGVGYRILLDLNGKAANDYQVDAIPTFILIDAGGKVLWQETGYEDGLKTELEKQVEAALKTVTPLHP